MFGKTIIIFRTPVSESALQLLPNVYQMTKESDIRSYIPTWMHPPSGIRLSLTAATKEELVHHVSQF